MPTPGLSFSFPTASRSFFCASDSVSGVPSEKRRATVASRTPSWPSLFPAMSTLAIATTSTPSDFSRRARCCDPIRPCSSPATATRYTVSAGDSSLSAFASSSAIAVPLALSIAPGASAFGSITSLGIES